ncbi:GspE/PulE family protein [Patescibacteria group bacterium]|nr:GspE/PulE family protein [Patescibacteria group bacterium]
MISQKQLEKILLDSKLLPKAELEKAISKAKIKDISLQDLVVSEKIIPEQSLFETIANYFHLPFIDLRNQTIRKDILTILPEPIVQTHQLIIFDKKDNTIKLACLDPNDLEIFEFIKKKTDAELEIYITTPSGISDAIKQYHKGIKARFAEITDEKPEAKQEEKKQLKELAQDLPVIRIVDTLLEYAIFESASDIHIEPNENEMIVRYRIDGILRQVMTLPKKIQNGVVARIKILSNLKLDEHRLPQDGRFKVETDEYKVAFRVSILPVYDGEKIVLRLLNESAQVLTLEQLGLLPSPLDKIKRNIKKPHGIILVTGPTGSGKTTTLYTILNILNSPGVNISTVEDPIEYRMNHVNQSQVNPKIGFTFASGLRSILRQDPDIVMVGEIRDNETAEISSHAAMTGHLVLSTLHTNDAVGAPSRLMEMGVPSFLIASTTNLVIAQRLVRRICPYCITSYNLTKTEIEELKKNIDINQVLSVMEREQIIQSADMPLQDLLFFKGKGCKKCNNEGYKGRIGIYEILEITPEVAEMILNKASEEKVLEEAKKQDMITIMEDGFVKAKNGITTIEEVIRVTKE